MDKAFMQAFLTQCRADNDALVAIEETLHHMETVRDLVPGVDVGPAARLAAIQRHDETLRNSMIARLEGHEREARRMQDALDGINRVLVKHEIKIGRDQGGTLAPNADRLRMVIGHYVRRAEVAERKLERNEVKDKAVCVESPDGRHYPERRWLSNDYQCRYCKKTLLAPEHGPMSDRCRGRGWIRHSGPPQDDWIHTGYSNPAMAPRCTGCVDCKDKAPAAQETTQT